MRGSDPSLLAITNTYTGYGENEAAMSGEVTLEFLAAVAEHTGVPTEFLRGDTIGAVWDSAQAAVDWKNSTAPAAPAAAPVAGHAQVMTISCDLWVAC